MRPSNEPEPVEADRGTRGDVHDTVAAMLPWMTSLLVHLGVVVLALFVVWSVAPMLDDDEHGPTTPYVRFTGNVGEGTLTSVLPPTGAAPALSPTPAIRRINSAPLSTGGDVVDEPNTTVGPGDLKDLIGRDGGTGGQDLLKAPPGQGGGTFIGIPTDRGPGGNARKVVFVVDASGSLIDTLPFVIKELRSTIKDLDPRQQYAVIFFQNGQPLEVPPARLKPATPENKEQTIRFITTPGNVVARGSTNPIAAAKLAMSYKPDLMFILSDNITGRGQWAVDRDKLLRFFNESNADRKTTINTIQFIYPDPLHTLEDLAADHNGAHKFITESDLK